MPVTTEELAKTTFSNFVEGKYYNPRVGPLLRRWAQEGYLDSEEVEDAIALDTRRGRYVLKSVKSFLPGSRYAKELLQRALTAGYITRDDIAKTKHRLSFEFSHSLL